eukprot:5850998-Amphidinium_carterae.1
MALRMFPLYHWSRTRRAPQHDQHLNVCSETGTFDVSNHDSLEHAAAVHTFRAPGIPSKK